MSSRHSATAASAAASLAATFELPSKYPKFDDVTPFERDIRSVASRRGLQPFQDQLTQVMSEIQAVSGVANSLHPVAVKPASGEESGKQQSTTPPVTSVPASVEGLPTQAQEINQRLHSMSAVAGHIPSDHLVFNAFRANVNAGDLCGAVTLLTTAAKEGRGELVSSYVSNHVAEPHLETLKKVVVLAEMIVGEVSALPLRSHAIMSQTGILHAAQTGFEEVIDHHRCVGSFNQPVALCDERTRRVARKVLIPFALACIDLGLTAFDGVRLSVVPGADNSASMTYEPVKRPKGQLRPPVGTESATVRAHLLALLCQAFLHAPPVVETVSIPGTDGRVSLPSAIRSHLLRFLLDAKKHELHDRKDKKSWDAGNKEHHYGEMFAYLDDGISAALYFAHINHTVEITLKQRRLLSYLMQDMAVAIEEPSASASAPSSSSPLSLPNTPSSESATFLMSLVHLLGGGRVSTLDAAPQLLHETGFTSSARYAAFCCQQILPRTEEDAAIDIDNGDDDAAALSDEFLAIHASCWALLKSVHALIIAKHRALLASPGTEEGRGGDEQAALQQQAIVKSLDALQNIEWPQVVKQHHATAARKGALDPVLAVIVTTIFRTVGIVSFLERRVFGRPIQSPLAASSRFVSSNGDVHHLVTLSSVEAEEQQQQQEQHENDHNSNEYSSTADEDEQQDDGKQHHDQDGSSPSAATGWTPADFPNNAQDVEFALREALCAVRSFLASSTDEATRGKQTRSVVSDMIATTTTATSQFFEEGDAFHSDLEALSGPLVVSSSGPEGEHVVDRLTMAESTTSGATGEENSGGEPAMVEFDLYPGVAASVAEDLRQIWKLVSPRFPATAEQQQGGGNNNSTKEEEDALPSMFHDVGDFNSLVKMVSSGVLSPVNRDTDHVQSTQALSVLVTYLASTSVFPEDAEKARAAADARAKKRQEDAEATRRTAKKLAALEQTIANSHSEVESSKNEEKEKPRTESEDEVKKKLQQQMRFSLGKRTGKDTNSSGGSASPIPKELPQPPEVPGGELGSQPASFQSLISLLDAEAFTMAYKAAQRQGDIELCGLLRESREQLYDSSWRF